MNKTIIIPLDQNYSYEFPSRICLVCGKLEREKAVVANTSEAWLCDRCKSTLLKLINDFNASNALNALDCVEERGNK